MYMAAGWVSCTAPHVLGGLLMTHPHSLLIGQSVGDVFGFMLLAFGPLLGAKSHADKASDAPLGISGIAYSRNILFAALEEKVEESVSNRMHREVKSASENFSWETIKLAAHNAIQEEKTMRNLADKIYNDEDAYIKSLPTDEDSESTAGEKYDALYRVLRHCSFRRINFFLTAVEKDVKQ